MVIDSSVIEILTRLGLKEKEALVYVSLLNIGPSTILEISRSSKVKRTTVYSIIDSLNSRGLIRKELHGIKELFVATNPENLKILLAEQKSSLSFAISKLSSLSADREDSSIRYYSGMESLKTVYKELLEEVRIGDFYFVLSDSINWYSLAPSFFDDFLTVRSGLDVEVKLIFSSNRVSPVHTEDKRRRNESYKFLSNNSDISTNLVITPKQVFFHSLTPPIFGMVIKNSPLIQMHKEMFNLMWQSI